MQEPFVPSINMVKNRTDILGIQGFSRFEIPTKYQSFKSITIQLPLRRFLDIPLSTLITNTMQSTYILFQHQNMLPTKVLFPLPLLVPPFSLKKSIKKHIHIHQTLIENSTFSKLEDVSELYKGV